MKLDTINASTNKFRIRSEAVIYNKVGVVGIFKGDYILFPGGGIDAGETAVQAVIRESIEEADVKLLEVQEMGVSAAVWPDGEPLIKGFNGERTHFFIAKNGGLVGAEHEDREHFIPLPYQAVLSFIEKLIGDSNQQWAASNNMKRKQLVLEAQKKSLIS